MTNAEFLRILDRIDGVVRDYRTYCESYYRSNPSKVCPRPTILYEAIARFKDDVKFSE